MRPRPLDTALLLLALAAPLAGQVGRTSYAGDGEGRLLTGDGRASQQVTRVEAVLYQNGGLELGLLKGRNRWVFQGTWSGDPLAGSVGIRLDEALDRAAEGTGRLYLGQNRVDRLRFTGTNRDGRFEFSFEARAPADDSDSPASGEVATTRNGEGSVTLDSVELPVTRARVRLSRGGRAQIRLWGESLHTIDGRWTGDLAGKSVRLSVPEWDGDDADLRGTVTLSRRNGWDELRLAGPTDRGPVKIAFDGKGAALEYDNRGPLVGSLERTMRGTGSFTVEGRPREAPVLVRIHLKRDWTAVVQVQGAGERTAFQGTWLQRGQEPRISLELTGGTLGRGTSGGGTMEMVDDDRWRDLSLSGRGWSLTFRAAEPVRLLYDPGDEGAPLLAAALATEQAGSGSITLFGQRQPKAIRKVRVALRANREAEIAIEGDTTATLTGKWSPGERPGQVGLALTGGTLKGFRGTGRLELTGELALARLTVEGRIASLRSRLEFTAARSTGP